MTRVLLLRHAESVWNAEQRWQGRADPPLSETGRNEAKRAAAFLEGRIDVVLASPQIRAYETASIIATELGLGDVATDDGFCEVDVGAFSGLTIDEVEARYAEALAAWRTRDLDVAAPGGETRREMLDRAIAALERTAAAHEGKRVLVITHGGVIGTLKRHVDGDAGPAHHLTGWWFVVDGSPLRVEGERVAPIVDPHEPAPEAR